MRVFIIAATFFYKCAGEIPEKMSLPEPEPLPEPSRTNELTDEQKKFVIETLLGAYAAGSAAVGELGEYAYHVLTQFLVALDDQFNEGKIHKAIDETTKKFIDTAKAYLEQELGWEKTRSVDLNAILSDPTQNSEYL